MKTTFAVIAVAGFAAILWAGPTSRPATGPASRPAGAAASQTATAPARSMNDLARVLRAAGDGNNTDLRRKEILRSVTGWEVEFRATVRDVTGSGAGASVAELDYSSTDKITARPGITDVRDGFRLPPQPEPVTVPRVRATISLGGDAGAMHGWRRGQVVRIRGHVAALKGLYSGVPGATEMRVQIGEWSQSK